MKVMVYDPGATTGWARCELDKEANTLTVLETGTFKGYLPFKAQITPDTLVIYEVVRACTLGFNPAGIHATGALFFVLEECGAVSVPQNPAGLVGPRKWLKSMGVKFKTEHETDSVAHALLFATNKKLEFFVKMQK